MLVVYKPEPHHCDADIGAAYLAARHEWCHLTGGSAGRFDRIVIRTVRTHDLTNAREWLRIGYALAVRARARRAA